MPIEKSAGHNTSTDQKTKPPEGGFLKSGRTSQIIRHFASHPYGAIVAGSDVVSLRSARTYSSHLSFRFLHRRKQKAPLTRGPFVSGRTSQIIRRFASHPFGAIVAGSDVVSLRSARTASAHLTRPENKKPRLREALLYLVGLVRFELTTFAMSTRRSNQLSYSPEVERIIPTVGSGSSLV